MNVNEEIIKINLSSHDKTRLYCFKDLKLQRDNVQIKIEINHKETRATKAL